jgi:hypothetical protein
MFKKRERNINNDEYEIRLDFYPIDGVIVSCLSASISVETPPVDEGYAYGQDATITSVDVLLMESFPFAGTSCD